MQKDLPGKAWFQRSYYGGWGLGFNSTVAPLNDIKLRKAIELYIDREEWSQLAYGGFASLGGMNQPGSYWADPDFPALYPGFNPATKKQDQAEALQIIKDGNYAGLKFGILCRDNYLFNAEAADAQLRKMGLNSFIDIVDTNRNTEREQSGQYQAVLSGFGSALPANMATAYVTANPLAPRKTGDAKMDEYDRLLNTIVDPVKRRQTASELGRYVLTEKYYMAPGPWEESTVAVRTYIKGLWTGGDTPLQNNAHHTVWMDLKLRAAGG